MVVALGRKGMKRGGMGAEGRYELGVAGLGDDHG